ncbi:RHS repeat domain-containing protein [Rhizobacter sp. P5_C2]
MSHVNPGQSPRRYRTLRMPLLLLGLLIAGSLATPARAGQQIVTTRSFDYDAAGWLLKEVVEPGDSDLCLVTKHERDEYGNVRKTVVRNCAGEGGLTPGVEAEAAAPGSGSAASFNARTTTYVPTADHRFVAEVIDAAGLSSWREYEPSFGRPSKDTDANHQLTSRIYDEFGRILIETLPDGSYTTWTYYYCSNGGVDGVMAIPPGGWSMACDATPYGAPIYFIQQTRFAANRWQQIEPYIRTYFGEGSRVLRVATQGFDAAVQSVQIFRDSGYDDLGRLVKSSRPYFVGKAPLWVSFNYDALNRVTSRDEPGDFAVSGVVTTYIYSGLESIERDPLGHFTTVRRNPVGMVESVVDARLRRVSHFHDALDNLTATQDPYGNVVTVEYDRRGRKTALKDPDLGPTTFNYNAVGEVVRQVDAKGQATLSSYDGIGRLLSRTDSTSTSRWHYDDHYADGSACANAKRRLCEAIGNNGYARRHQYDMLGRPLGVTTTLGAVLSTGVSYDAVGRVATRNYPSGLSVSYDYTALGYLQRVRDGRTGAEIWAALDMDAAQHVGLYVYGNRVVTADIYSQGSARLVQTTAASAAGTVQAMVFEHDDGGRLSARTDIVSGVTSVFDYDELDRVRTEVRRGGGLPSDQSIGWDYDDIGNITRRTENGVANDYAYNLQGAGNALPHAVAAVSGSVNGIANPSYLYDANGNMYDGAGRSLTWTSFDKVASISKGNVRLEYVYDTELQRAQEIQVVGGAPQRTTLYLNPADGQGLFYEEENGPAGLKRKHYISAGGRSVAMIVCGGTDCTVAANSTTQYLHQDDLGSVTVVTDAATGAAVLRMAYEPFGKRRYDNGQTDANGSLQVPGMDRGFTAHEHLDEVALINMNGRVFDPALARFMSADPGVQYQLDLQSFNRYSYVRNNPTNATDPSGYEEGGAQSPGAVTITGSRPGESSGAAGNSGQSKQSLQDYVPAIVRIIPPTPEDARNGISPTVEITAITHSIYSLGGVDNDLGIRLSIPKNRPFTLGDANAIVAQARAQHRFHGPYMGDVVEDLVSRSVENAVPGLRGLANIARNMASARGPAPGNKDQMVLYRRGPYDNRKLLKEQAADAENQPKVGNVHGVSTFSIPKRSKEDQVLRCASACDVEAAGFKVHKTGGDPYHYTVELPKPVTPEVTQKFNDLFKVVE